MTYVIVTESSLGFSIRVSTRRVPFGPVLTFSVLKICPEYPLKRYAYVPTLIRLKASINSLFCCSLVLFQLEPTVMRIINGRLKAFSISGLSSLYRAVTLVEPAFFITERRTSWNLSTTSLGSADKAQVG